MYRPINDVVQLFCMKWSEGEQCLLCNSTFCVIFGRIGGLSEVRSKLAEKEVKLRGQQ